MRLQVNGAAPLPRPAPDTGKLVPMQAQPSADAMKTCSKCGETKSLTEFNRHRRARDGRQVACRACQVEDHREWKRSEVGRASTAIQRRRWNEQNQEKRSAHKRVEGALRSGQLARPDCCDQCGGGGRIEAHHHDYAQPLEVTWLCQPCHRAEHRADALSPAQQREEGE